MFMYVLEEWLSNSILTTQNGNHQSARPSSAVKCGTKLQLLIVVSPGMKFINNVIVIAYMEKVIIFCLLSSFN